MKRIGFLGTGWTDIGQIKAFKKSGLIPQAISSRVYSKAELIANKYDIPEIYTDWKKLVQSETIDLVSIVLPTWLHSDVIKYTRRFNKPFICEAPFNSSNEITELLPKSRNLEIIDYELRFTPHFQKVKELISNNEIGDIQSFNFRYLNNFSKRPDLNWDWSNDINLGGGHLNLVGGHFIDLANYLFLELKAITKSGFDVYEKIKTDIKGKQKDVTADDESFLELEYTNGVIGKIFVSQMAEIEQELTFEIIGQLGSLKVENNQLFLTKKGVIQKIKLNYDINLFSGFDNNLFTIGTYFLGKKIKNFLEKGEEFEYPNLNDCLINQQIIEEAYKTLPNIR